MAESDHDQSLINYLQQAGIATADQVASAQQLQAHQTQQGKTLSLTDALVSSGIISAEQRQNIEKRLQAAQQGGLTQLGNYKLLKKLGEGGMGAVYLAEDTALNRRVALKVLPRKLAGDREFQTRFRREAKAAGKLTHANIIGAYAVGEELGHHYYAMEFCPGESLDTMLKRSKALNWKEAIEIVMQVARGLQHAHSHGFIHRDIKPANIMVTHDGTAKILDLGLSKNIEETEKSFYTQTGQLLGTPHYLSPEQAIGEGQIDGRTDIYSLGATFFHLVCGRTPYVGNNAATVVMKHISGPVPDPREFKPDLPPAVANVIQRMLAKKPAERHADCAELLADLEAIAAGRVDTAAETLAMGRKTAVERAVDAPAAATANQRQTLIYSGLSVAALALLLIAWMALSGGDDDAPEKKVAEVKPVVKPAPVQQPVVTPAPTPKPPPPPPPRRREPDPPPPVQPPDPVPPAKADPVPAPVVPPKAIGAAPTGDDLEIDLGEGVTLKLKRIPAGKFIMGSAASMFVQADERQHEVTLTKPFYMGIYETTVGQFKRFVAETNYKTTAEVEGFGEHGGGGRGIVRVAGQSWRHAPYPQQDDHPVVNVTWDDAQEFMKWLSKKSGFSARLPTEAQWEYACRAGTTTVFNFGHRVIDIDEHAWCAPHERGRSYDHHSRAVGKKKPNAWGLYDMHGNVTELCADWVGDYDAGPVTDPQGPATGTMRVRRGGAFNLDPRFARSSARSAYPEFRMYNSMGFRVLIEAE